MFAGHVGAALAIGRWEPRINLGVIVLAALLLDLVLWLLVLLGWETVAITANFASTHQPEFVFPYSHGLLAAIAWSLLAGLAIFLRYPHLGAAKLRAAVFVGMVAFSHWLLDALVHAPELPVAGVRSAKVGLGLWNSMPAALAVEALITLLGLWLFLAGADLARSRKVWLSVLVLVTLAFTVAGMTIAPPPPSAVAMAASSLVTIVVVCALAGWLGKRAT
jgi:hypothetical protein